MVGGGGDGGGGGGLSIVPPVENNAETARNLLACDRITFGEAEDIVRCEI